MSQPTTFNVALESEDSSLTPEEFATAAHDSLEAVLSSHSGTSRPSYAVPGTIWFDTATSKFYGYDGTNDVELAVV